MNIVAFAVAPSQVLVYQIRAEEAFTIVITADDGFLTGNSWDGKIWKMQGQMPGKSRIPVGAKEGDGSEFIFSENPQEKGMLYEGWCMFVTKEGETFRQRWEFVASMCMRLPCGF